MADVAWRMCNGGVVLNARRVVFVFFPRGSKGDGKVRMPVEKGDEVEGGGYQ